MIALLRAHIIRGTAKNRPDANYEHRDSSAGYGDTSDALASGPLRRN